MTILETKQLSNISHDIISNTADGGRSSPLLPSVSLSFAGLFSPATPANGSNLAAGQFQDLRDTGNIVKSKPGMYWCYTHLADLPLEKKSPDPRYAKNVTNYFYMKLTT